MTYAKFRLMFSAFGALFLGGCITSDMPAYINGGKTIVAMVHGEKREAVLWTYDLQSKKATSHSLSKEGWDLPSARMIGEQVWIEWYRYTGSDKPGEYSCKLFDPVKNEFIAGPKELEGRQWVRSAIPVSYDDQKCLFLPTGAGRDADGKIAYDIFTFPELKKKTTVKLDEVLSAGGFRWVTVNLIVGGGLGQVEVFNQEGKQVILISHDEARKMAYNGGRGRYARINEVEKTLLLFFGEQGFYTFGIFDISNGKFLWGGHIENEEPLNGNPLVKQNEAWSLEEKGGSLALVRRMPGDKAKESKLETILKFSDVLHVEEYTPSPDGSHFVAAVNVKGKPSRLMFIPIKEGVTEKDVEIVELIEQKTSSK